MAMTSLAQQMMDKPHTYAIAPAGCGKTQTIVEMVALNESGKQLILTHTHAGVQSLAKRLRKHKVSTSSYHLETIAGWSLRLARSYPSTSGFSKPFPNEKGDWEAVLQGVTCLVSLGFMKDVLCASYSGVIVDEYQDCTQEQHALILALSSILPCRILGDPLQGIFNIGKHTVLVDWNHDIHPHFAEIPHDPQPYRWQGKNPALGAWLMEARQNLLAKLPISLNTAPVAWVKPSSSPNNGALWNVLRKTGTIVAIHPKNTHPNACHKLASQLKGNFQSLEEMEAKDLLKWADRLDTSSGGKRACEIIDFASECSTKVSTALKTIKQKFEKADTPDFSRLKSSTEIASRLSQVVNQDGFSGVIDVLKMMRSIPESSLYRADLWHSMLQAIELYQTGKYESLREAAWHARQRQKNIGRTEYPRIISRTLLIKGLEYDHGILLDAHLFDRKNLYVALTRASTSLTILSESHILKPR